MPADRSRLDARGELSAGFGEAVTPSPSSSVAMSPSGGIAFAQNVTPGTFNDILPPLVDAPPSESLLFPEGIIDAPEASTSSRKPSHSRKKPDSYIPRPPNAFILFRSAFIRSRNVSTKVETNHSTLSKIIGMTWQNLPEDERQVWHRKAKQAEADHRAKFPQYAFKPMHSRKAGGAKRRVREVGPKDHVRCAKIADFLVQGLKGKALDAAIKEFDKTHVPEIVTRFEAPITEASFTRPAATIQQERPRSSGPRKSRSASSASSYCSSPSVGFSSPSPAPSTQVSSSSSWDADLFQMPRADDVAVPQIKSEPSLDFHSFSFNTASSNPTHLPDQSRTVPSIDPFSHPPSAQSHPVLLPQLEPSFLHPDAWSSSQSPDSPSTISMPSTPHEVLPDLPAASFFGFEAVPAFEGRSLPLKSETWPDMALSEFGTYQDTNAPYACSAQYNELNSFSSIPFGNDQQFSTDIDFSVFMASLPPYTL